MIGLVRYVSTRDFTTQLSSKLKFNASTLKVTPYHGDGGIDVTGVYRAAGLTDVNVAVQAKRWKGNVQAPTVTSLRGSLQVHQQGIIITTSDFSSGARKEAEAPNKTHITLIDGEKLIDMLVSLQVGVREHIKRVNALDDEWWGELLNVETTALVEPPANKEQPVANVSSAGASAPTSKTNTVQKPEAITLFDVSYPVKNWKGVLITVCTVLAERHPEEFSTFGQTLHGAKRPYISTAPETMFAPSPIPGTALYVETNMSSGNILQLVNTLLEGLGHPTDSLHVTLKPLSGG